MERIMLELNRIYSMDLFDGLKECDDNSINLVVTSPPYFDARNYGGEALFSKDSDWENWCSAALQEIKPKLAKDGVIWWNTGSGYNDFKKRINIYSLIVRINSVGIYLIDEIPWIKMSGPPKKVSNRPHPMWEHNFILAKSPELVTYYRDNVRIPYAQSTLQRMQYRVSNLSADKDGEYNDRKKVEPNPKGANPPNYLPFSQDTSGRPHPAPMNPQLANWAIRAYSKEGGIVLDPMMGAGTVAVEAKKENRNFIGFDLVEDYVRLANMSLNRLERGEDPYNGLKAEWENKEPIIDINNPVDMLALK
jgi:DNA modification methylase